MSAWSIIAIVLSVGMTACGSKPYDLASATDRAAMKLDIQKALTASDCPTAIDLSAQLYQSKYSDNDIRMLYASAQACNVGIVLFSLIDQMTSADLSAQDSIFKTMVKLFPSKAATDSRMESAGLSLDALQSILKGGSVISPVSSIFAGTQNPGSTLYRDHTDDANSYEFFIAMALVGTTLNRYAYNSGTDPASINYAQQNNLPWATQATITADSTFAACGTASGMLNLFDSIHAISGFLTGKLGTSLNQITDVMETGVTTLGNFQCLTDLGGNTPANQTLCDAAGARLRYRQSCKESPQIASFAAGIIHAINLGWQ